MSVPRCWTNEYKRFEGAEDADFQSESANLRLVANGFPFKSGETVDRAIAFLKPERRYLINLPPSLIERERFKRGREIGQCADDVVRGFDPVTRRALPLGSDEDR